MPSCDEILVFDFFGDYAHFRKSYTTVSQLTYGVPPRTTLAGMIAAILGMERDSYYHLFQRDNSKFAVSLAAPTRKQKINLNLLKTKGETLSVIDPTKSPPAIMQRIQVPFEMVKNPRYTIYTWFSDQDRFSRFEEYLRDHKSVYTLYLGISELLGDFKFIGKYTAEEKHGDAHIDSIVVNLDKVTMEPDKKYIRERIPGFFNQDRVPEYVDLVYEPDCKPILVEDSIYWQVNGNNIILF